MKATGIVRKVDELGRIVLPIELRRTLNIEIKDPLEIYVDGESIMLKKYQPACVFCGSSDGIRQIKGKNVCAKLSLIHIWLSIARNLVELQGGSFHIHIDGDLFKVVIEFPLYHGMPYAVTIPEK